MKRYAALLLSLVFLFSLSPGGLAQASAQSITKQITVYFPGDERTGTYTGEAVGGIPNGQGSFTSSNSENIEWTYTGQWKDGAFDGEGATVWADGWEEHGLYAQNVLTTGKWISNGTVVYDGSFAWNDEEGDEIFDGEGKLYNDLGRLMWEGQFSMGCLAESSEARLQRSKDLAPLCEKMSNTDYAGILKNEGAWIGRMVRFEGKVTYVWDEDWYGFGEFEVSLNRSTKRPVDVYYRYGVDEERAGLDQTVTVLGTVTGVYRYDDGTGNPYVAPMVQADVILHQ